MATYNHIRPHARFVRNFINQMKGDKLRTIPIQLIQVTNSSSFQWNAIRLLTALCDFFDISPHRSRV